jgi:hypothetical protein
MGHTIMIILSGLLGLMMLFIFAAAPASIIVFTFDIPDTYLGVISLSFMFLYVALIAKSMRKEKEGWQRDDEKRLAETHRIEIVSLASNFDDSRKNIDREVEREERRNAYRSDYPMKSPKCRRRTNHC